jgi:hypothetical protein
MHIRRWVLTPLAVALVMAAAASMDPVQAQQQPKKDKNLEKAQKAEIDAILKIADGAAAGQAVPSDVKMTFHNDFLKALEGKTYVPFTLEIPAVQLSAKSVTLYLRVVAKTPPAPAAAAPAEKKDEKKDTKNRPQYAFEDVYFPELRPADAGQPYRLSRAFTVAAGEYDVLVCLKERLPFGEKEKKPAPVFKTGYLKQTIAVPDYWGGQLATSSIILAANVEPLTAPLTREEQVEQPYTLGMTKITPNTSNKLPKKGELSLVFIIYNTGQDANKKPDVTVEYQFFQKVAGAENGEKFFNKTNPQNFNAQTLPPQFDPSAGHQLVAGQSVPLGSFPEGEYRLEVKVTDKLSGKVLTHNLPFTVAAS